MQNRIDLKRPDAPVLADFGPHAVGVRTMILTNPDQIDIMNATETLQPRADRPLVVEFWYPAAAGTARGGQYETVLRDGHRKVSLHGIAAREAAEGDMKGPLVVLSHGFPGNRMLMAHLGEHLASHGYRVASIDHRDSTYDDPAYQGGQSFGSTLYNRPLDTAFVADALGGDYAIIGFSMGGYGALISAGGGIAPAVVTGEGRPPAGLLALHAKPDVSPRLKAVIPIGPWGRHMGYWDAGGLAQMQLPCLMMAGSADDISDYQGGMRRIFTELGGPRWLLTFNGASHNAAAAIPAPAEAWDPSPHLKFPQFTHYADPVWDTVRMNNIAQHFALAFLNRYLKGDLSMASYLDGSFQGFDPHPVPGLTLEYLSPQ